jgi:KaiC/GvpD/RAD55 family RecA-like ATPase
VRNGVYSMSDVGIIPPSIENALSSSTGYVLVVTGRPGTGKSLFVQEIFRKFSESCMILTSTENYRATEKALSTAVEGWDNRHILAQYWRPLNEDAVHDAPLRDQLSKLVGIDDKSCEAELVIIDAWTDFIEPIHPERRYELQQSLIFAARQEGKKVVFVTEGEWAKERSAGLYHSSDGVIVLEKIREGQRMYRQITLEKMRSFPINQDSFLFTLTKGRFTYIPWYIHQYPAITTESESIPDPSPERISTGNSSLDSLLGGGFLKGRMNLIEVENLGAPYLETIYIPFLSNHLQLGRPAVILLPEGWSPSTFTDRLTDFVDKKCVDTQVVFFGRHALGADANVRSIEDDSRKTLQEIRYEATQLERQFNQTATELFALDTLENKYGPTAVKEMIAEISASLSGTERATITILSQQQAMKSEAISHAIHIRVQEICGVLSVCGINPRSNYLAIRPILSTGFMDYNLLPIV